VLSITWEQQSGCDTERCRLLLWVRGVTTPHDYTIRPWTTTIWHTLFMSDLDMDDALPPLDLPHVPSNVIIVMLKSMSLAQRFTCALVCKAWAEAATAVTRSIILRDSEQDFSCLQRWLEKHGGQVEVLQLHKCPESAVLTTLPCSQLHDLLLKGNIRVYGYLSLDSRVWSDIAAATKLTSVTLERVRTASQQADVVSALTALPDLEQLTWWCVECGQHWGLTDSMLLQTLTKLTALALRNVEVAAALEHLGLLTRLQDLSLDNADHWATAGWPRLQELKALTRLKVRSDLVDSRDILLGPSVSQLTALQQLDVPSATPGELNKLSALTGLTQLWLQDLKDLYPASPPLQLANLQHLVAYGRDGTMPMMLLARCTQLRVLKLWGINFSPGSLVANSMLQRLELDYCGVSAADRAAGPISWQQVFPGRLPHLTSLRLIRPKPSLQHADTKWVVACCSSLQVLDLDTLHDSFTFTLTRLPALTSLILFKASDQQCSSLAQLTGLRELGVHDGNEVSAAGLRQLAALEQLTSLGFNNLAWSSDVLRDHHMSDSWPGPDTHKYAIINQVCVFFLCVNGRGTL